MVFNIGFLLSTYKMNLKYRYNEIKKNYLLNLKSFHILIFMEIIFTLYLCIIHYKYISSNYIVSIYQSLRHGITTGNFSMPASLIYVRSFILILTICMTILYFNVQMEQKKIYKKLILIQYIISIVNLITIMTRNDILKFVLPIFIVIIICKNLNNKIIIKYAIRFLILFSAFFITISIMKNSYLNTNMSKLELTIQQFSLYMSGSIVGLEKYLQNPIDYLYGQNTFRFFYALSNDIFSNIDVQELVQEFIYIGTSSSTNVFTFYQYYIKDFGIIYALLIQFLIGIFHGVIYCKMLSKKPMYIFLFSIMSYPLLMQFFQDQYISLLSTWIQYIIIATIFFKTNIFVYRSIKINKENKYGY